MSGSLSSDYLFHFTNSFEIVKLILKNGLKVSECQESYEYLRSSIKSLDYSEYDYVGEKERLQNYSNDLNPKIRMICFCDIPPELASENIQNYGNYAIDFSNEWGAKNDINPLFYINTSPDSKPLIAHHLTILHSLYINNSLSQYNNHLQILFSNTKTYEGLNSKTGKFKRFYDEREWRFIPGDANWNLEWVGDDQYLKFSLSDVAYIIVEHEDQKKILEDFLHEIVADANLKYMDKIKLIEELLS